MGLAAQLGCGVSAIQAPARTPERTPALVVSDVTVVDVRTGSRRTSQTVLVRGHRIVFVGDRAAVDVPHDATVVDGRGGFLIPGLWDMHVHAAGRDRARRYWSLFRAHGVTGVREMGNDKASLLFWQSEAAGEPDAAPRIVWSSPMLDGDPPTYDGAVAIRSGNEARSRVREMRAGGFDFLKVYNGLPREAFLALADEASRVEIPIAGEVPTEVAPLEAAAAGMRSFEHLWNLFESCVPGARDACARLRRLEEDGAAEEERSVARDERDRLWIERFDPACGDALARGLRTAGTWQTPTLVINRSYSFLDRDWPADDSRRRWVPARFLTHWDVLRARTLAGYGPRTAAAWHVRSAAEDDLVRRFSSAGVGILAGSDATDWEPFVYAGASLHDELALLVEAGLSSLEALRAATIGPATFLDRDDLGVVEAGNLADLVLLDADRSPTSTTSAASGA